MRQDRLDKSSLTRLALRTVQEIEAAAGYGPVQIGWGDRLALEWLIHVGAAEPWQARSVVEEASRPLPSDGRHDAANYIRSTYVTGFVVAVHYKLGLGHDHCDTAAVRARRHALEMVDPDDGQPQPWLMCNRFRTPDRLAVERLFGARTQRIWNDGPPIVHPREPAWVIRQAEGELVLEQMSWGFPVIMRGRTGAPLKPKPVNNARIEKLDGFWRRWAQLPHHRCLIPATAFAEAEGPSGMMRTTWLSLKSAPVFAWAGLWNDSEEWGRVMTGVMTVNAPELAGIHDRGPVIVPQSDWLTWLQAPLSELTRFARPWPADDVKVVRTHVLWKHGGSLDAYTMPPWPFEHGNFGSP